MELYWTTVCRLNVGNYQDASRVMGFVKIRCSVSKAVLGTVTTTVTIGPGSYNETRVRAHGGHIPPCLSDENIDPRVCRTKTLIPMSVGWKH